MGRRNGAAEQNQIGLPPKKAATRVQIGFLARLNGAHMMGNALGDGRIDGIFRNVAFHPEIIILAFVFSKAPALPRILCAVCQVRMITSPTRPMAWLSDDIMENTPRS